LWQFRIKPPETLRAAVCGASGNVLRVSRLHRAMHRYGRDIVIGKGTVVRDIDNAGSFLRNQTGESRHQ